MWLLSRASKSLTIFPVFPEPRLTLCLLQLSWVERKMAATLFAAPPAASLPEAVEHFLRAEQLRPAGWKENRLFLAKCSIGQGEYNQAVIWLDRADSIPSASQDVREGIKVSRAEW